MHTDKLRVMTCRDAADEVLKKWWRVLPPEDLRLCLSKLYDQSGNDTPEQKMRLNKLFWEGPSSDQDAS